MYKRKQKRYHSRKESKSINRKQMGGASFLIIILLAVAFGILFVVGPIFQKTTPPPVIASSCLDYDPPSSTDTITFNNERYGAVKKNAGIVDSKMVEMTKIGSESQGADVYQTIGNNYFGEKIIDGVIYVLRDQKEGYHYFDIYIKDGLPIPDEIRNSKNIGGNGPLEIITDDNTIFPPQGFDVKNIKNLSMTINHASYVYDNIKTTTQNISNLKGISQIGNVATSKGDKPLFYHLDTTYIVDGADAYEYAPNDLPMDFTTYNSEKDNLQLRKFTIKKADVNPICWYTPECKPAIYLYPEKKTSVNVKVFPKGYFTYTNPKYPGVGGWQVIANPDGTIESDNDLFQYLYYESNIRNSEIKVPTEGYVAAYDKLTELYNELLPKLGLSNKEIRDFKDYWNRVLPKSPYYFVGIMDRGNIDDIEEINIVPRPTTVMRVRLYFEALKSMKEVPAPNITLVKRPASGFTVVEWGGMVKSDPNSEFTCSQ